MLVSLWMIPLVIVMSMSSINTCIYMTHYSSYLILYFYVPNRVYG